MAAKNVWEHVNPMEAGEPAFFEFAEACQIACCDCGLVHVYVFEPWGDKGVIMRPYRDDFATKLCRDAEKRRTKSATRPKRGEKRAKS